MVRQKIPEAEARRLLGGAPVLLVTTRWQAASNVFAVAWAMPVSTNPPLLAIAVHPSRHSHDMISFGESFAINIPARVLLNHTQWVGMVSGMQMEKLDVARLPHFRAKEVEAPLIEGCVGWIECTVSDTFTTGDHTLFVGKIVAAHVDTEAWDAERKVWSLTDEEYQPLHYLGGQSYAMLDSVFDSEVEARSADQMEEEGFGKELEEAEAERRRKREEAEQSRAESEQRGEEEVSPAKAPRERPEG
ncbi:MAG: flavin reductase family protein [Chloroflexi bacterium]|nr:flavin reductase family protein [Chloroflexota bacterium]